LPLLIGGPFMNSNSFRRHRAAKQPQLIVRDPAISPARSILMKRILASVAALGLIATPVVAATTPTKAPATATKAKPAKADKAAKKADKAAKKAAKTAKKADAKTAKTAASK
jgi:hypothetical protein